MRYLGLDPARRHPSGGLMHPRLDLIDLDQTGLEGYRRFISCWLSRDHGPTFIVDPGPASTAGRLIARLGELGVARLDRILLTHIHLDHGGATAALLAAYPDARVVCHRKARKHLVAPERLWEGSRQVLGELAERYGEPRPIGEGDLSDYDDLARDDIQTIETPGHAPHHVSFLHRGTLFVGEAAGTFLRLDDGGWYLRPATPPRFVLDVATASLDRLLAVDPEPERLAFAHHGLLAGRTRELLTRSRRQHEQWVDVVREERRQRPELGFDALADRIVTRLRREDPDFARGRELPADIAVRERDFTRQTLRGMVQYVESEQGDDETQERAADS
ncbi:MBL fold metallo-hydrolase [bacterium]|nr:MBL fold metallo-hydrolase [bacterium]